MAVDETPVPLPNAPAVALTENLTVQPPLSRRGYGPALLLIIPAEQNLVAKQSILDPLPLQKWAEEGYAVVQWSVRQSDTLETLQSSLRSIIEAISRLPECDAKDHFAAIVYNVENDSLVKLLDGEIALKGVVLFGASSSFSNKLSVLHVSSDESLPKDGNTKGVTAFTYSTTKSSNFIWPNHDHYDSSAATLAHSRSLAFVKERLGGPFFDLNAIWDEHTDYEFTNRSVAKTMGTMVQEPYVNHVPTMTGGIGRAHLSHFYRNHFIFNNPQDTVLELVSRTIGIDRVIDEFIYCFTHTMMVDWLVPGIPPTGKAVRIPMTSVVNIRGDRLYHEHIAWDQASVLRQLGLLPEYLPYPYPLADGQTPAPGKRFEYRLPVAGVETATKLVNEHMVESNSMFEFKIREVDI